MDKSKSHYLVHGLFWKEQMHNAEDDRKIKEAEKLLWTEVKRTSNSRK